MSRPALLLSALVSLGVSLCVAVLSRQQPCRCTPERVDALWQYVHVDWWNTTNQQQHAQQQRLIELETHMTLLYAQCSSLHPIPEFRRGRSKWAPRTW